MLDSWEGNVCVCVLYAMVEGKDVKCILAKPGSHQQWVSGAGESPKLPLLVCQLSQKIKTKTSVLH